MRTYEPAPREEHRVLFPALGKYLIQFGQGQRLRVEFYNDPADVGHRLNQLWRDHHSEAQARLTTWSDVVLWYQNKL